MLQSAVVHDADTLHAEEFRLALTKAYGYAGTVWQLVMFAGDETPGNTVYLFFRWACMQHASREHGAATRRGSTHNC